MRIIACLVLSVFVVGAGLVEAADKESQEGWVELFNGQDLTGWNQKNGTATYVVKDGTILGTTAKGSPNSFLCTDKDYANFILEFDVKVDPRLNSGVQIRSSSLKEYKKGRVHGYQCEIATNGNAGYIYDEGTHNGWISNPVKRHQHFKNEDWNHYRIVADGGKVETFINGEKITEVNHSRDVAGFIGLQVHSFRGDSPAWVQWRNIRLKELPLQTKP